MSLVGDWSAFNDNGSAQTRTHNAVHELIGINANPLTYDAKGNLTANSNGQTHTWDFENCMKTAVVGTDTATYTYDAFRRRVTKNFQGTTTVFVYDGWRSISEYENGAALTAPARVYVFGTYLDEALMMLAGSTKYYYHANDLYSVAALTNSAGTVVERYKYDPYGKVTVLDAAGTAKSDPNNSEYGNPFLFQGQRVDKETGLGQWRLRYYDYGLGRFLNRNPWGYVHSFPHLYDFVDNQVTVFTEPFSRKWIRVKGTRYSVRIEQHGQGPRHAHIRKDKMKGGDTAAITDTGLPYEKNSTLEAVERGDREKIRQFLEDRGFRVGTAMTVLYLLAPRSADASEEAVSDSEFVESAELDILDYTPVNATGLISIIGVYKDARDKQNRAIETYEEHVQTVTRTCGGKEEARKQLCKCELWEAHKRIQAKQSWWEKAMGGLGRSPVPWIERACMEWAKEQGCIWQK